MQNVNFSLKKILLETEKKISDSDTIWLLTALLQISKSDLYLSPPREIAKKKIKKFKIWVERRAKGEPLQYITETAPFFGRDFFVSKDVLIPRPETESLVELVLREGDYLQKMNQKNPTIIDIGTGSGIIPITLKLERDSWIIGGSDISAAALRVAKKNSKKMNARIKWKKGNLLEPWNKNHTPISILVANLPYIDPYKDRVAKEVKDWEPSIALFPRRNKKSKIKNIGAHLAESLILQSMQYHLSIDMLCLELSARVANILELRVKKIFPNLRVERESDLLGRKRFLLIKKDM